MAPSSKKSAITGLRSVHESRKTLSKAGSKAVHSLGGSKYKPVLQTMPIREEDPIKEAYDEEGAIEDAIEDEEARDVVDDMPENLESLS